jgi:hypothetical protein
MGNSRNRNFKIGGSMEEKSFAMDLLKDYKKQNKRQFIIILILILLWFVSIGIFIYYINTTGYEVVTETAETSDSGNACVGDNCNNGDGDYGKSNQNYKKKN